MYAGFGAVYAGFGAVYAGFGAVYAGFGAVYAGFGAVYAGFGAVYAGFGAGYCWLNANGAPVRRVKSLVVADVLGVLCMTAVPVAIVTKPVAMGTRCEPVLLGATVLAINGSGFILAWLSSDAFGSGNAVAIVTADHDDVTLPWVDVVGVSDIHVRFTGALLFTLLW